MLDQVRGHSERERERVKEEVVYRCAASKEKEENKKEHSVQ